MTNTTLKPCPFCGGTDFTECLDGGIWPDYMYNKGSVSPSNEYVVRDEIMCNTCGTSVQSCSHGERLADVTPEEAKQNTYRLWNTRTVSGDTSDGYHTFDELYYHRTALFACLVASQPRQMAFKAWKHADGTMYDDMFIAGIYTSRGWCTYHCESKWWPLFDCSEREFAPEWDGHTPSDAIHRLMGDFLPKQEVCGEVGE